jgi:hypothetical protein
LPADNRGRLGVGGPAPIVHDEQTMACSPRRLTLDERNRAAVALRASFNEPLSWSAVAALKITYGRLNAELEPNILYSRERVSMHFRSDPARCATPPRRDGESRGQLRSLRRFTTPSG